MYASYQIPKPTDEQAFERGTLTLFRCVLGDPNASLNGRRGQGQQGVDVFGKRAGAVALQVGVQCKLKSDGKPLTERTVREEVTKALQFEPLLDEYFVVTTAPDDVGSQKLARILEKEILDSHQRKIAIQIWGWETMAREIQRHPDALETFWPDFTPYSKNIEQKIDVVAADQKEVLNRIDRLEAGISAPGGIVRGSSDDSGRDPLEQHLDREIDAFRDYITQSKPKTALDLLRGLQNRLGSEPSDRIQFRIKANIASCLLEIGDEPEGLTLMFEACAHTPEAPKAKANKAIAHLLSGQWQEAVKTGKEGLALDPTNEELAGYLIQALRFDDDVANPLAQIPEQLHVARQVQIAHLYFLQQRGLTPDWWIKAEQVHENYPEESFAVQSHAEAVIDRVLTEGEIKNRFHITDDAFEAVRDAHRQLLRLWEQRDFTQAAPQVRDSGLFTNLILACDLLGEVDLARTLIATCPQQVLVDDGVATRLAQLGFNHDDRELFEKALANIEDGQAKFHFECYHALENQDWAKLIELTNDGLGVAHDYERELLSVARRVAELMEFQGALRSSQFTDIGATVNDDLRCHVLILDALAIKNFDEAAESYFERTVETVLRSDQYSARAMLAQRASRRKAWSQVAQLLTGYADVRHDTDQLRMLATAYVNMKPATQSAVRFFKNLPSEVAKNPYYLERAAVFHFNRGALAQSENCYRAAITVAERPELGFYMPLLSLLVRRQKHREVSDLIEEMLALDLHGDSEEQIWLAHFLMKHGHPEKAMETAYHALIAGPDEPEPHSGFCNLVLMNTRLGENQRVIPKATAVQSDCWVEIQNDNGEKRGFLYSSNRSDEAQHLFPMIIGDGSELVKSCQGKRVGDTFEQDNGFGIQVESWKITAIKHKYDQSCRVIMDEFDLRFPNSRLMGKMTMVDNDVEPILTHIRNHAEHQRGATDYYTQQGFPISLLAATQGGTSIEYAGYLRSLGFQIHVCRGLHEERREALDLIEKRRMGGVTVDAITAWTMHWIGAFDAVKQVFGVIRIAQSCVDEVTRMIVEAENHTDGQFSISWRDGQYFREEHSADEIEAFRTRVVEIRDNIVEYCDVVASEAPDETPEVSRVLIENFSPDLLDPAFCALNGGLLLSEDMFYRQMAAQEFDIPGVWLQSVLMFAVSEKIVDFGQYCQMCASLAESRHGHLSVSADVLMHFALIDDDSTEEKFEILADQIGTESADIFSHYSVVQATVASIWQARQLDATKRKRLTGFLISKLIRHRKEDWQGALAGLYMTMNVSFRAFLQAWMKQQALPKEKFDEAFRVALNTSLSR